MGISSLSRQHAFAWAIKADLPDVEGRAFFTRTVPLPFGSGAIQQKSGLTPQAAVTHFSYEPLATDAGTLGPSDMQSPRIYTRGTLNT